MAIDTGARSHGRAVSRIGPTPRAQGRTPAARTLQYRARDATLGSLASGGSKSAGKTLSRRKQSVSQALSRVMAAYKSGSVSGPLSDDQKAFALGLSKTSGMSPRLAAAETLREGGHGGSDFNYANIGWTDSGPDPRVTNAPEFATPTRAGKVTGKWLQGKWGQKYGYVASPGIQAVGKLAKSGASDEAVGRAWSSSGWASSGAGPLDTYNQVQAKPGKKPDPKDVKTVQKAGISVKEKAPTVTPKRRSRQTESAAQALGPALTKWLHPASSDIDVKHLNPVFARHLVAVAKESGEPIEVTSGYRSVARQAAISSGTNPKAAPGYSDHQFGMAADISATPRQRELMAKHGLETGNAGPGVTDPPHTELTSEKAIRKATKFGPVRAAYAPSDVPMAVGDLQGSKPSGFGSGSSYSGSGSTGSSSGGSTSTTATAAGGSSPSHRALARMTPAQRRRVIQKALAKVTANYSSSTSTTPSANTGSLGSRYGHPAV